MLALAERARGQPLVSQPAHPPAEPHGRVGRCHRAGGGGDRHRLRTIVQRKMLPYRSSQTGTKRMTTTFQLDDVTIHRVVEQENGFTPAMDFLPNLTPEILAENRGWLEAGGWLTPTREIVLCYQSHIIRTPHHVVLIDTCYGNEKTLPRRPSWHMSTDGTYMRNLEALGPTVD